jgi:radical SAM protein with 4Fe4S-binding SPASM domain
MYPPVEYMMQQITFLEISGRMDPHWVLLYVRWIIIQKKMFHSLLLKGWVNPMIEPELKVIYWNVTRGCNQRCKYCWISAGIEREPELKTEQWLQIFDTIIDRGLKRVKVTGGEPLQQWRKIKKVMEVLIDHGIRLSMETNGTLICGEHSQDILKVLRNDCVTLLSVSLDSCTPSIHDEFRGMKKAFVKTMRALDLLKENQIPFSIVTVLHSKNYGQIQDIIEFVSKIEPICHQVNIAMPEGRAKINAEYQLSADFYVHQLPSLIKRTRGEGGDVQFNVPYIFNPLDRTFHSCSVGKKICGLLPTGDIAVCAAGINKKELVLGNALEDDIGDIWVNSPAFLTLRKSLFESRGICGNCLFAKYCRGFCRANSFAVYGQLDAPFPICQMLYEQGVFPAQYTIDPDRDCSL